jgi:hypothetical protein
LSGILPPPPLPWPATLLTTPSPLPAVLLVAAGGA